MGLLGRRSKPVAVPPPPPNLLVLRAAGQNVEASTPGANSIGKLNVGVSSGLESRLLIISACLQFIAARLSTLPVRVLRADGREIDPPNWLLEPSKDRMFFDVVCEAVWSLLQRGNWFVVPHTSGSRTIGYESLHPDLVSVAVNPDGSWGYTYTGTGGKPFEDDSLVHLRWFRVPGTPLGVSAIDAAMKAFRIGDASQDFTLRHFKQGGALQYVVSTKEPVGPAAVQSMARELAAQITGPENAWRPLFLDGLELKTIGVTAEQAKFLEMAQWSDIRIASQVYKIAPSLLGLHEQGTSLTYNNQKDRESNLWRDCLQPLAHRIGLGLSVLLPRGQTVTIDSRLMLAGSPTDRFDAAKKMTDMNASTGTQVFTVDEIREMCGYSALTEPPQPIITPAQSDNIVEAPDE